MCVHIYLWEKVHLHICTHIHMCMCMLMFMHIKSERKKKNKKDWLRGGGEVHIMTKKKEVHKEGSFFSGIRKVQKAWETLVPLCKRSFLWWFSFLLWIHIFFVLNRKRRDNFASNRNLGRIIVLVDFITNTKSEKHRTRVVLALEMAKAFSTLKAQTKRVFNVGRFHLAPSMIVIFLSIPCIYLETPIGLQTRGPQTCHCQIHGEKVDCFNSHCRIIQRPQLVRNMLNLGHLVQQVHNTTHNVCWSWRHQHRGFIWPLWNNNLLLTCIKHVKTNAKVPIFVKQIIEVNECWFP